MPTPKADDDRVAFVEGWFVAAAYRGQGSRRILDRSRRGMGKSEPLHRARRPIPRRTTTPASPPTKPSVSMRPSASFVFENVSESCWSPTLLAAMALSSRGDMQARIGVLTIGVDDLERSLDVLSRRPRSEDEGIVGTEFEYGAVAFFELQGGLKLALWPREHIARDAEIPEHRRAQPSSPLVTTWKTERDVDLVMAQAEKAGARDRQTRQSDVLGRLRGYFEDSDGHAVGSALESAVPARRLTDG